MSDGDLGVRGAAPGKLPFYSVFRRATAPKISKNDRAAAALSPHQVWRGCDHFVVSFAGSTFLPPREKILPRQMKSKKTMKKSNALSGNADRGAHLQVVIDKCAAWRHAMLGRGAFFHQFVEGTLVKFARRFFRKSVDAILPSLIRNIWRRQMFLVREGKIGSRRLRKKMC